MKNKKMIFAIVAIFLVFMIFFAACKKKGSDGIAYVTDENGVQLTDTNGEPITVVPETSIVTITDGNGNVVTNENGEPETSIHYKPQQVGVPVTDINHEAVTGENGEVLTTLVWFPADPTTTSVETVTVTDSNGNPVTNPGETVTEPNGNPVTEPNGDPVTKPGTPVTETTIISSANKSFSKTMGGTGVDEAVAVSPASDGGVFAAVSGSSKDGMFQSISNTKDIAFAICKYDNEGNLVWSKPFGSTSSVSVEDICGSSDGGVIIVGNTRATDFINVHGSEYDAFIMKLDKDGNEIFRKSWGGTANENFNGVKENSDGSIYAAGFAYSQDGDVASLSIPAGDSRAIIVKFNANGDVQKCVGVGGFGDYFADLAIARNGDIFAVASMSSGSTQTQYAKKGGSDAGVFKFDKELNLQFGKVFGGSGRERFEAIAVTDDGGCVIAGASTSSDGDIGAAGIKNKGDEDAMIVKFSGSGSIVFVQSFYGNKRETFKDITVTSQGYIIAVGEAESATRDFATIGNQGGKDVFVTRFDSNGNFASAIGYGGSGDDSALAVCTMANGQIVIAGSTASTNGDFGQMHPASDGTNSVAFIKTVSF